MLPACCACCSCVSTIVWPGLAPPELLLFPPPPPPWGITLARGNRVVVDTPPDPPDEVIILPAWDVVRVLTIPVAPPTGRPPIVVVMPERGSIVVVDTDVTLLLTTVGCDTTFIT